jgi:hypothetical protein
MFCLNLTKFDQLPLVLTYQSLRGVLSSSHSITNVVLDMPGVTKYKDFSIHAELKINVLYRYILLCDISNG